MHAAFQMVSDISTTDTVRQHSASFSGVGTASAPASAIKQKGALEQEPGGQRLLT